MRRTLIAAAAIAALVAGCGGNDNETAATPTPTATPAETATRAPSAGKQTLAFSAPADGALKFDQGDVSAKAGSVTVTFDNPSPVPHAVEIEGNGVSEETETVTQGKAPTIQVDLAPGTYTYYCPVDGHEAAGMKGTLTVK